MRPKNPFLVAWAVPFLPPLPSWPATPQSWAPLMAATAIWGPLHDRVPSLTGSPHSPRPLPALFPPRPLPSPPPPLTQAPPPSGRRAPIRCRPRLICILPAAPGPPSLSSARGAAEQRAHWWSAAACSRFLHFHWLRAMSVTGTPRPPECPSLAQPRRPHSVAGSEAGGAPADGNCCRTIDTGPRPASLGEQQEEADGAPVTILQLLGRPLALSQPVLRGPFLRGGGGAGIASAAGVMRAGGGPEAVSPPRAPSPGSPGSILRRGAAAASRPQPGSAAAPQEEAAWPARSLLLPSFGVIFFTFRLFGDKETVVRSLTGPVRRSPPSGVR